MDKERESRMLAAAAFLVNRPIDEINMEDLKDMVEY